MEFTFLQLKQKDVVSVSDGKNLGKVCDITFNFPENNLLGITVTGGKGFKFTRQDIFIPVKCIVKIGEDTVLVRLEEKHPPEKPPKCPPKRPPRGCPPGCPPDFSPDCPPPDRRSYDEYE